jgi:hypothetical protein
LQRPDTRFQELTGRRLDPLWRAPGGRTTPNTLAAAQACGYRHVGWAAAGFLGDELPSETYPNSLLLQRALDRLKDGDIVMAHLGIWSRKDPFAPMLDPLIAGLKARASVLPRGARSHDRHAWLKPCRPAGLAARSPGAAVLLAMGLGSYLEMAFDGIEFFLCGVLQISAAYLLLRPLEALRPIEVWPDRQGGARRRALFAARPAGHHPAPRVRPAGAALRESVDSWLRFTTSSPGNSKTCFRRWRRGHCSVS